MTTDPSKTQGRITEDRYRELVEGHRTTLVVGMMDMLEALSKYLALAPETRTAFEPLYEYAGKFESDQLREVFDAFLERQPQSNAAVGSSFLSMLIDKSHALKN
jgi:hypothetical protein